MTILAYGSEGLIGHTSAAAVARGGRICCANVLVEQGTEGLTNRYVVSDSS